MVELAGVSVNLNGNLISQLVCPESKRLLSFLQFQSQHIASTSWTSMLRFSLVPLALLALLQPFPLVLLRVSPLPLLHVSLVPLHGFPPLLLQVFPVPPLRISF